MIAGIAMPVLVLAWLGAAAAPCVAMTVNVAAPVTVEGSGGDGSTAHQQHAGSHHHSHDDPYAVGMQAADGAERAGGCPHCPEAAAGHEHHGDSHTSCVPAEDVSGQRERPVPPKLDVKHAIPGEQPVVRGGGPELSSTNLSSPQAETFHDRPLNLRYCVFLN